MVAELDSSDERFESAESVFDAAKLAEGWNWFEYEGSFRGFVENREVGKDLEVSIGALVHLRPSSNSPILATIEEGDPAKVIWAGDWVQIDFTKAVPVYFRYAGGANPKYRNWRTAQRWPTPPKTMIKAPTHWDRIQPFRQARVRRAGSDRPVSPL